MVYNVRRTNFNSLENFITWHINKQKRDFNQYSNVEIEKINSLIKIKFYNKAQYKWQVKKVYKFIRFSLIPSNVLILFLNSFYNYFYSGLKNEKGKKGVFDFLNILSDRDLKDFDSIYFKGFEFKEGEIPLEFVQEMKVLKEKYLCISHNYFVNFIHENFNTKYTKQTLRRYYFNDQK